MKINDIMKEQNNDKIVCPFKHNKRMKIYKKNCSFVKQN